VRQCPVEAALVGVVAVVEVEIVVIVVVELLVVFRAERSAGTVPTRLGCLRVARLRQASANAAGSGANGSGNKASRHRIDSNRWKKSTCRTSNLWPDSVLTTSKHLDEMSRTSKQP
jgi:hypothetical protein